MKTFLLLALLVLSGTGYTQSSIRDLALLSQMPVQKFDAHILKKEYRRDYYSPRETHTEYAYYQQKPKKKEKLLRTLSYKSEGDITDVGFQTSSEKERNELLDELRKSGFVQYNKSTTPTTGTALYQKDEYTVAYSVEIKDTITLYTFLLQRKELPRVKDVAYAEDLLPYASHEYLKSSFGAGNVRQDVFYYSESETNRCSVLFPDTEREVIFVWQDEQELRRPAFLLVGGNLKPDNSAGANRQLRHNLWRSKQGVYAGMSLQELQELNNGAIRFYGWHTEQAGMLLPQNSGSINFKELGLVLHCINCDNEPKPINVVSSNQAIQQAQKVHVATLVILPHKDGGTAAVQR